MFAFFTIIRPLCLLQIRQRIVQQSPAQRCVVLHEFQTKANNQAGEHVPSSLKIAQIRRRMDRIRFRSF